ncbi:MAG TPA: FecR family protein, partial [Pyrinomonadaceae bacterium]|nr:FecR family protein [Pyrinomonadaceae bacterium]
MRNTLKTSLRGLLALAFAALCAAGAAAQGRDARVISARAGGVNFRAGQVEYNREGGAAWRALSDEDELQSGDAVRTGAGGRVELLLNPGSYLRAGEGAQFELADASLEDLRLKLVRGSAVIEATGYGETDLSILVEMPQARVRIVRSGIYRFNVLPEGVAEVGVQKGRIAVGAGELLVKGGHMVRVGGSGQPEVAEAKFRKEDRDALDLWSRERGKELAKMNEKVSSRQVAAAFDRFDSPFFPRLYGVWYFNPRARCYTFLPFYSSWGSPYGHSYWSWLFIPDGYRCNSCAGGRGPRAHAGGGSRGVRPPAPRGTPPGGVTDRPRPVRSQPA